MKKLFVAILALLYMGTSIGATIELHYCMGRLVEWSLRYDDNDTCRNCGMAKEPGSTSGCCKDEHKQIKIDKDQKLSLNYIRLSQPISEPGIIGSDHSIFLPPISSANFTKINSPPRGCNIPLTILNCVFRI
ncbi:MAG TPA: hypothetical protein VGQ53_16535 [Chitinophagaceae bacterium]|jgi:hypothetical protein|nr:hypothetical protein [Chitinophagaceae bacterium]